MFRNAAIVDAEPLTKLSFDSKRYWEYSEESYFELWADELTITADYIRNSDVQVYTIERSIISYYSIVDLINDIEISGIKLNKGYWLEHMFVEPRSIGKGVGAKLFSHMRNRYAMKGG